MSIYVAPRAVTPPPKKASPVGPGSGVLLTEFPLASIGIGQGAQSVQNKMQRFWSMGLSTDWIAAAEDAIGERFSGVEWHLEDGEDVTIEDDYPNKDALAAVALLEAPGRNVSAGAPYYRSDLWGLTCRAMGVCGSAFIFLDQEEAAAKTPAAMLPIAPWRMTPQEDASGNLIGWWIDKTRDQPGIAVRMDQILHFQLRRGFQGHFGTGNIEAALRKAQLSVSLDDHMGLVLSAGGRLSGILSPSSGALAPEQMLQMERDWRTVVEQSDAAKRLQLVAAPMKFDRTTLTPQEMQIRDLVVGSRDDLLAIWGVPLSIIGGTSPAGLNSGDTRKYDEAAIWQGPVHHRLNIFREVVQFQLLDRWKTLGQVLELELDEPEFDDDSPRYDLLGKSLNTPLTNMERRALIGMPPIGDPAIDNAILLPATIVPYLSAPLEAPQTTPTAQVLGRADDTTSEPTNEAAALAAGETSQETKKAAIRPHQHAIHTSLVNLRGNLARSVTPRLKSSVAEVLRAQRDDIAARLRKHADAITRKPRDASAWWDGAKWDARMTDAIRPHAMTMAESVTAHVATILPPAAKAAPVGAVERVLKRGAARVTNINTTTRDKINEAIIRGLDGGLSVLDVADLIENGGDVGGLSMSSLFDEYRSEMVARTELMDAYNGAALGSYADAGVEMVQAIDGDDDDECAARDGSVMPVDEADSIEDHPNGTLDWVPVFGEEKAVAAEVHPLVQLAGAISALATRENPAPVVNVYPPAITAPVHVEPAIVNVAPAEVHVHTPSGRKVIDRDAQNRITGMHEEPS